MNQINIELDSTAIRAAIEKQSPYTEQGASSSHVERDRADAGGIHDSAGE